MKALTARQQEVFDLIRDHISQTGMPPTRAEIAQRLGFRSPNAAEEHLKALARKGVIEIVSGASRGIRLLQEEEEGLPLVGRVAAGEPLLAQQHIEGHYQVDPSLFKPNADFLLRVSGMSMKDIGILSLEDAISYGVTGPSGRASGWKCDIRKIHPYGVYDKVDFKEIVYTEGDCFARYLVRMDEIMESLNIIEQLIDNIPEGPYQEKMKPIIRVPEGSYYAAVEGSRGEFGVFLESQGDKTPYRLHYRATGLPLVAAIDTICRGTKIADLIAIGGTIDYVVPDIDR